jgi:hypothetical protein
VLFPTSLQIQPKREIGCAIAQLRNIIKKALAAPLLAAVSLSETPKP